MMRNREMKRTEEKIERWKLLLKSELKFHLFLPSVM